MKTTLHLLVLCLIIAASGIAGNDRSNPAEADGFRTLQVDETFYDDEVWHFQKEPNLLPTPGKPLTLDGSYQNAFQDFHLQLVKTKIQLPVLEVSKWSKVIETNKVIKNPEEVLKRVNAAMENVIRSYRIETSEGETFEGFNS